MYTSLAQLDDIKDKIEAFKGKMDEEDKKIVAELKERLPFIYSDLSNLRTKDSRMYGEWAKDFERVHNSGSNILFEFGGNFNVSKKRNNIS